MKRKKCAPSKATKLKLPPGMKADLRTKKLVSVKPPRIGKLVKRARDKGS